MANSPRARRTLSIHELARFFTALADTGNFALACDRIGRAKSGLYKRRARDPIFAADVEAALAQFRIDALPSRRREGLGEGLSISVRPERSRGAHSALRNMTALKTYRNSLVKDKKAESLPACVVRQPRGGI